MTHPKDISQKFNNSSSDGTENESIGSDNLNLPAAQTYTYNENKD